MSDHNKVQKLLEGCPDFPTVRDIATETEPRRSFPRTDAEDSCRAVMPGDSMEGYVFEDTMEPNPYLHLPRLELREMASWMEGAEGQRVRDALRLQQLQHSDGKMPRR